MNKLALQADLRYNEVSNIVVSEGAVNTALTVIHLIRRCILDTIPLTSGIYKITCTANKKIYIGSATNLRYRWSAHFHALRKNRHENQHLQRAWNKYGEHAFTFEVLELVLPMSLTVREQYWFKKLKPFDRKGFNIAPNAGSPSGIKHTPEQREKLRQAMLGNTINCGRILPPEHIERIRQATLGRKHTPEAIERIREAKIGKKLSPETREKIRQAHLGMKASPETKEKMSKIRRGKQEVPQGWLAPVEAET